MEKLDWNNSPVIKVDKKLLDKQLKELSGKPSQETLDGIYNMVAEIWDKLEEFNQAIMQYKGD